MVLTGSINCRNGELNHAIRWIYIMMLKHHGWVDRWEERFDSHRHTRNYVIRGASGFEMEITFNLTTGSIEMGTMSQEHRYTPVYEIGGARPVEYVRMK